jgi:hypothetical protein
MAQDFRKQVIDVIPMAFLIANDVPGATGPTPQCDVVQAIRDLTASGRRVVDRCKAAEADRDDLLEALIACNNRLLVKGMIGDPHDEAALTKARAAISKARGEA